MSLPDTIFIFVLALIIFGPKKLPEIGRQLGRLVGEFRRASNEFKFQIEEELRQAERNDPPKNLFKIEQPKDVASTSGGDASTLPAESDFRQPPGSSSVSAVQDNTESETASSPSLPDVQPTIRAATGAQPRTTLPYAGVEPVITPAEPVVDHAPAFDTPSSSQSFEDPHPSADATTHPVSAQEQTTVSNPFSFRKEESKMTEITHG